MNAFFAFPLALMFAAGGWAQQSLEDVSRQARSPKSTANKQALDAAQQKLSSL